MRSSTSSSDDRLPRGGWERTWALALLLVLVPLLGLEIFWRAQGYPAEMYNGDDAWVLQMLRVRMGAATTAVLGTSRIQAALDPDQVRAVIGGNTAADLAIPGDAPQPIFDYIADSTRFKGLVVFEVMPLYAFDGTQQGAAPGKALLARFAAERVSPARVAEDWLQVYGMRYFVFRSPQLLPVRLAKSLASGRLPRHPAQNMRPDRFGPLDNRLVLPINRWDPRRGYYNFSYPDVESVGRPATPDEYAALTGRLERDAERIEARGGRVVFIYMGACARRLEIEEQRYPRARYWDPFARQTHAIALTTLDYPELTRFDCWDGSHIDVRDAPAYTRALALIIRRALAPGPAAR